MRPRLLTAAIACLGIAACKSNNNASTDSANGNAATPPAASADTAAASTAARPDSSSRAGSTAMSDANILAKADAGDSAEVVLGKYVRAQSTNAGVKSYASLLESDHAKGIGKVEGLAKKLGLQMTLPSNDTTAQGTQHTLDHLKSLKGHDLDTAFVNHEVEDHVHDIQEAKEMAAAAKDPQVKKLLEDELPELKKHLDRGQSLSPKLGIAKI
jgi:putative membrane protein